MSERQPWQLNEKEWDVTERLRVAAWLGGAGVRIALEDRVLEEQSPSLSVVEAKRLLRHLESALAWADKAQKARKGAA